MFAMMITPAALMLASFQIHTWEFRRVAGSLRFPTFLLILGTVQDCFGQTPLTDAFLSDMTSCVTHRISFSRSPILLSSSGDRVVRISPFTQLWYSFSAQLARSFRVNKKL